MRVSAECPGRVFSQDKAIFGIGTAHAIYERMKSIVDFIEWLAVVLSFVLFLALQGAFFYGLYRLFGPA